MNISYNVTFKAIRHRPEKNKPYQVRWIVEGGVKEFTKAFLTAPLADGFRSELVQATKKGEPFDISTGLPLSRIRAEAERRRSVSWYKVAVDYAAYKWSRVSAHQRVSIAEALVAVTCTLVPVKKADQKVVRKALKRWAFRKVNDGIEPPEEIREALAWVSSASPPLAVLADRETLHGVLDALARKLDGKPAAPNYRLRRSTVLYNMLKYCVARDLLAANPLNDPRLDWDPPIDHRDAVRAVDPRVVGSTQQVASMLAAVSYLGHRQGPRLEAFFGCLYYGMLRPEEAIGLTEDNCDLPESGWGTIYAESTQSAVGRDWTDSGDVHDERGLKHRSRKETRPVPIPPEAVALLRRHIEQFGVGPDGRVFRSVNGNPLHPSTYSKAWKQARELGLAPRDRRLVLKRPYDLRHAGVTARLYAGIPDRQVAEWAGHSVQMLRDVYSKILAGFENKWQDRMDLIFGSGGDDDPGPGGAREGGR